ncbi:DUF1254 domain-containing protein [Hyphomonas sp. WL0036]|uniref:DUF1254 domain-containing protein n=1 Tax=Hyphomonas sediminis TaxID=2866160 RepID=UPI001C80C969|nr:DUF1254 domain-containing protein [Hyphomonas sediminis]MBY9065419.1 DUF1254 domain-containing protein [Hyphomonas sediminis]
MKAFLTGLAAFVATFLIAHFVVLNALPGKIMSTVRGKMMDTGIAPHSWTMSARITPETQSVVRPSPDLAYAICLIDLSDGPVEITVPSWPEYGSLSIFEADTNNVYAGSLDARAEGTPGTRRVVVAMKGQDISGAAGAETVTVKKPEALALVRRLAPTQASYEAAAALIPASSCAPL